MRELYKMTYLDVLVFEGMDPSGEFTLTYAYAGNHISKRAYFSQILLSPGFRKHALGSCFFWQVPAVIKKNNFVAFGLHDCYATYWLPRYREFLAKIKNLGQFKTLNEVADEIILANSE